jgi:hypothetical protein
MRWRARLPRFAPLAGILIAGIVACGEPTRWTQLEPEGGRFEVDMPGVPRKVEREVQLSVGKAPSHLWMVEDGDRAFIVGYTEFPSAVALAVAEDELLDTARDRAVRNVDGRLLRDDARELAGHRGRSIEIDAKDGVVRVRGAYYVAGPRLYQVMATTTPGEATSERVERFLASFALEPPEGP